MLGAMVEVTIDLLYITYRVECDEVGANEDEHDVDNNPDERGQDQAQHVGAIVQYWEMLS